MTNQNEKNNILEAIEKEIYSAKKSKNLSEENKNKILKIMNTYYELMETILIDESLMEKALELVRRRLEVIIGKGNIYAYKEVHRDPVIISVLKNEGEILVGYDNVIQKIDTLNKQAENSPSDAKHAHEMAGQYLEDIMSKICFYDIATLSKSNESKDISKSGRVG